MNRLKCSNSDAAKSNTSSAKCTPTYTYASRAINEGYPYLCLPTVNRPQKTWGHRESLPVAVANGSALVPQRDGYGTHPSPTGDGTDMRYLDGWPGLFPFRVSASDPHQWGAPR